MDAALRAEIVARLDDVFDGARDVGPAGQPLHVLLDGLELPSGWTPNPTRALTVWDGWPESRPAFYVDPAVSGPGGYIPQNPSDPYILGEHWRTFSFAFPWKGDDSVRAIQRWLTIFDTTQP